MNCLLPRIGKPPFSGWIPTVLGPSFLLPSDSVLQARKRTVLINCSWTICQNVPFPQLCQTLFMSSLQSVHELFAKTYLFLYFGKHCSCTVYKLLMNRSPNRTVPFPQLWQAMFMNCVSRFKISRLTVSRLTGILPDQLLGHCSLDPK